MNAELLLNKIAAAFHKVKLDAVMIGNAAAALHGAPVTTLDIDFMIRKTASNLKKLKKLADELEAHILKPFYPISSLYRIMNEDMGIQLDFMTIIHGINSFESLNADAVQAEFGGYVLKVASLEKIIRSKKALNRAKDRAVLELLEKTLYEIRKNKKKTAQPAQKRN
ncbi:MAG: hypothetical protein BWK80_48100 [Desulfobacteraceae bacterium IS3]|nr:MAG: hypothetical protein BWK80_48100 [Desulfobacteraceae bacterium IS3]